MKGIAAGFRPACSCAATMGLLALGNLHKSVAAR